MADLDKGGTFQPMNKVWQGPSIGWVQSVQAILRVSVAGTTIVSLGTAVIVVSTTSAVTIQLPQFKGAAAGAGAVPGTYVQQTMTIIDTSGAPNITITPAAGETISGLASLALTAPFGAFVLEPDPINGGSTVVS